MCTLYSLTGKSANCRWISHTKCCSYTPFLNIRAAPLPYNTVLQLISSRCFQANPPGPPRLPAPPSGVPTPLGSLRGHYTLPTYSMPYLASQPPLASHRLPQSTCHLEPMIILYMAPQIFFKEIFLFINFKFQIKTSFFYLLGI